MPTIVPLSRERHAGKGWRRFDSYHFASRRALVPLVAAELPKAVMAMPIAFLQQGEAFIPVALLGFETDANLFVASDGRWLGRYIPSAVRGYPFSLGRVEQGGSLLCVDEDSGLVVEETDGEAFFSDSGEPSEAIRAVLGFLQQVEANRVQTENGCAALGRHGLITPWPIIIKGPEGERRVDGLFQLDEAALNALSDEAFLDLRRSGALVIAYCQMLSMQHLPLLGELAKARTLVGRSEAVSPGFALSEEGLLRFD